MTWALCRRQYLPRAKEQPEESHAFGRLENTAIFGVAGPRGLGGAAEMGIDRQTAALAAANDTARHTDQQMFR
jgi:hypothetical protein